MPEQDQQTNKLDALMSAINDRISKIETTLKTLTPQQPSGKFGVIATIFGGLFFLALGGLLLFLAQEFMSTNHAGITFVLVVLGVALILYGTGTHGQLTSGGGATYNVAIAGGAGVIAFAVAYGIIQYSTKMRDAFQPERKFIRVLVQGGDGVTNMSDYTSTFEIDGNPIPSAISNKAIEVYVPYLPFDIIRSVQPKAAKAAEANPARPDDPGMCPTPENRSAAQKLNQDANAKSVSGRFYRIKRTTDPNEQQETSTRFVVRLDEQIFRGTDGGVDYPVYPVKICVNLQQVQRATELLSAATELLTTAQRALSSNLPPDRLSPVPNALIEPQ